MPVLTETTNCMFVTDAEAASEAPTLYATRTVPLAGEGTVVVHTAAVTGSLVSGEVEYRTVTPAGGVTETNVVREGTGMMTKTPVFEPAGAFVSVREETARAPVLSRLHVYVMLEPSATGPAGAFRL